MQRNDTSSNVERELNKVFRKEKDNKLLVLTSPFCTTTKVLNENYEELLPFPQKC